MRNPNDAAQNPRGRGLPPGRAMAAQALRDARAVLLLPYFSKARLTARATGGRLVIPAGTEARFFAYGQRQTMEAGGFPVAYGIATDADTNIAKGGETNNGSDLLVRAMQIGPVGGSIGELVGAEDPVLQGAAAAVLKAIRGDVSVKLIVGQGGDGGALIGPIVTVPAGFGIYGEEDGVSALTSGESYTSNVISFGDRPIRWAPVGTGPDSNLNVRLRAERAIDCGPSSEAVTEAYVDLLCRLFVEQVTPLSDNQLS